MPDPSTSPPPLVTVRDDAIILTGDTGDASNPRDYLQQDWKWIEAVLTGASAVHDSAASAAEDGRALVNAQSLRDAGTIFNNTQSVMRGVANNLRAQAKGLAGDGRAWQGKAAEAFLAKMLDIANYLDRQAERINGGSQNLGTTVPNQLFHSGNVLEWAQKEVRYIDGFYATWASNYVKDYGDGVVHVSEVKGLPEIITRAMQDVMGDLVDEYLLLETKAVVTPEPISPDDGTPPPVPSPSPSAIPTPSPPPSISYTPPPSVSFTPPPSVSYSPPPSVPYSPPPSVPYSPPPSLPYAPPPVPSASPPPLPDAVPPPVNAAVVPPPDTVPPPVPPPVDSVPPPPDAVPPPTDVPPPPDAVPPPADVPPPPDAVPPPAEVPPPPDAVPPPDPNGNNALVPPPFPGTGPPGSTGQNNNQNSNGTPPPDFEGDSPPGGSDVPVPPETSVNPPGDNSSGLDLPPAPVTNPPGAPLPGSGGSPPVLPPMSPPQSNTGATDRSDSSGLVGGDAEDWESGAVPAAPNAPSGAVPRTDTPEVPPQGLPGLEPPSAPLPGPGLGGSPPVLPPMSPPQSNTGATDRSDSSGLVGGDAQDWESSAVPGAPEAPAGAVPGAPETPSGAVPDVPLPGPGLGGSPPVLPPMSPPQSNTGPTDRSDSSGLVNGDAQDWESGTLPAAPDAPDGARAGQDENVVPPPAAPPVTPVVPPIVAPRDRDRDERAEQILAGTEGDAGTEERDHDRKDPLPLPPFLMPPRPDERRRREERSEAGELLAEQKPTWDPAPTAGAAVEETALERNAMGDIAAADEDLPPDYVAMVRESEDDFSSWDSELLPWASDEAAEPSEGEDDPESWGSPDRGAAGSGVVDEAPAASEPDEPPRPRARPTGQSIAALLLAEMPIRSGGPDLTPEQREQIAQQQAEQARRTRIALGLEKGDDEDEEEPAERHAADLLDRDDAQWRGPGDGAVGRVIE